MTRWGLIIAVLTTCAQPPAGGVSEIVMDARPASAPFTSGSRLKIRWATAIGDRTIAVPLEIFDTKLDRVCVIQGGACVPKVDRRARLETFAFFDEEHAHPALLADPSECDDPATKPDGTLWAIDSYTPKLGVFTAESARTVAANALWIAGGTGCVIMYEHPTSPRCVRPLVDAPIREFVSMKEVVRHDGLVTMHGDDGSILPGAALEWNDAANDIRCTLAQDGCFPNLPSLLGRRARDERLALHVRVLPSGESVAIGLYDTKLGRDCVAKRTASGTLRCVVDHRNACRFTRRLSSDGSEHDVLAWSDAECKNDATCCLGGVVRIEAIPDSPPTRHGIDPHADTIPGTKERVIRFTTVAQSHDHVGGWVPDWRVQTYDAIEELDETAFAALEVARDP